MPTPEHPAVRTKGFQKPQPAPKKTVKEQASTQPEVAVSPSVVRVPNVPEVKEAELPVTAAAPADIAPAIEETAPPAPVASPPALAAQDAAKDGVRVSQGSAKISELPVTAAVPADIAPAIEETAPPAPAANSPALPAQDSAKGGVRVSQGFAKVSQAVEQRNASPVEVPAAAKTAAADYEPDLDAERVCRRQWWKYNLYVKSGRQAAENRKT